jgi:hypothetical protein
MPLCWAKRYGRQYATSSYREFSWDIANVSISLLLPEDFCDHQPFPDYISVVSPQKRSDVLLEVAFEEVKNDPELNQLFPSYRVSDDGDSVRYEQARLSGDIFPADRYGNRFIGHFAVDTSRHLAKESIIQISLGHVLSSQGRIMLHASGVRRDGFLWLFSGPSGAGKTTLATELRDRGSTFCIDRAVVWVDGDGRVLAEPTPFSDLDGLCPRVPGGEVAGIFFLEQSEMPAILPMNGHESAQHLLRRSFNVRRAPPASGRVLDTVAALVDRCHFWKLRFAKDTSFWKLIDGLGAENRRKEKEQS